MSASCFHRDSPRKPCRFIRDDFRISVGSYPIVSDCSVPLDFSRYFVTFLLHPLAPLCSIRDLGKRGDRFMDSLDNGGSGGSRGWKLADLPTGDRHESASSCFSRAATAAAVPCLHRTMHDIQRGKISLAVRRVASFLQPDELANQIRGRPSTSRFLFLSFSLSFLGSA